VEKEGDGAEEISESRQAMESPEALVEGLHLLRDLLYDGISSILGVKDGNPRSHHSRACLLLVPA